jgi:predicted restriction endonuclease
MRDYNDAEYKAFRQAVRARDKKCRWPGCFRRKALQVHHILTYAKFPHLRFSISNGITLCKQHHKLVKGKEPSYSIMFLEILKEDL